MTFTRVGDILYFAPKYKFRDLRWDDKHMMVDAFKDRVREFYLQPAAKLNKDKEAFAAGVLCATTVDFLAKISIGGNTGERIKKWLEANIIEFGDSELARRFYEDFRNGLVHEGRIKNAGQFSYEYDDLITHLNGVMVVNPRVLLERIESSLERYVNELQNDEPAYRRFWSTLKKDFRKDVELALR